MAPLTPQQVDFYESEGYLVIEDFASSEECKSLTERMKVLLDGFDPSHRSVFSTKTKKHILDEYFLKSADNISFFFEENAFDDEGNLKQPKELSINKVGHALHEKDMEFKKFSESSKVADVLMSLNYRKPILIQSMYIFKQPGIGGEVRPHQDSTYLYTDPPSTIGLWVALEDATKENGCLWALPKSHKSILKRQHAGESKEYDYSEFVPLEVKAGTIIVLHGTLVHQSFENKSAKSRHAYTLHAFESDGCVWSSDNWLQRSEFPQPLYAR